MLSLPEADDPRTYAIIGAALEVHRVLGAGFLELFYKDALSIEFTARELPFTRELASRIVETSDRTTPQFWLIEARTPPLRA